MSDTSHTIIGVRETSYSEKSDASQTVVIKRAFDIAVASLMFVLFLPLLALVSAIILIFDGPSVLFAHERIGRDGKKFKCLKFRTMVKNADAVLQEILENDSDARREWEMHRKLKNDPRIVPVIGKFLRKSSLDELPQIINVLRGDMSLVGPRPIVDEELAFYGTARKLYLSVRPGLTGPWQIGNRSDETYENRVKQDVDYIENWSLKRDLSIVTSTAMMFLKGRAPGAY